MKDTDQSMKSGKTNNNSTIRNTLLAGVVMVTLVEDAIGAIRLKSEMPTD